MTAIAIICTLVMAVGVMAFSMLFVLLILEIEERRDAVDTKQIYQGNGKGGDYSEYACIHIWETDEY